MKRDNNSRILKVTAASCILIIIVLIKIATFYPAWIEKNYSRGIYPNISWFYRMAFGWVPFSVGDILYATAGLFLFLNFVKLFKKLIKGHFERKNLGKRLMKVGFAISIIYIY